jgi:hypothetical protein
MLDILEYAALQGQLPAQTDGQQPFNPLMGMMYPPVENPFTPTGLVNSTKSLTKSSGTPPLSQADYLQKQLQAMEVQGMAQQQKGVEAYEKQLQGLNQQVNPWQAVAAGLSDFFSDGKTNKLNALQQQQATGKQLALAGAEKLQKAKNDISENQRNLIKDQLSYEMDKEKNASNEEFRRMAFGIQKQKLDKTGEKSDFFEAADKKLGQEYSEWQTGGEAQFESGLGTIKRAVDLLRQKPDIVGPQTLAQPMFMRKYLNPESVQLQQDVEKVVQEDMRKTLGAQFTENEGKQLLQRTFDPALPADKLGDRMQELYNVIEQKGNARRAAFAQAANTGSIKNLQAAPKDRLQYLRDKKAGKVK